MDQTQDILERLRRNEEIARKFFEVEASILSIFHFKDLFEKLLTEIREKFEIPYVWISLIDEQEVAHLVQALTSSRSLKNRLNIIGKTSFLEIIGHDTRPLLANKDLNRFYRMLPNQEKYLLRSVAIAPITLKGEIIGSLNHGDSSGTRYYPGMDATLLECLAVKVSICLSNVTAHEKLRIAASRDPLTDLLNRRVMESVLEREFKRALRYAVPLSLVFLDLDDFKQVNDRYGHDAGDALLKYFGNQLTKMSREIDVVARFAGDEFVIILPSTTLKEAFKLTKRLQLYLLENPMDLAGTSIPVCISFGVANVQDRGVKDPASLLKRADEMLYEAKKRKKGGADSR